MAYADPRGKIRRIVSVSVDPRGGPTILTFDCGHSGEFAQHFTYREGDHRHCFKCRQKQEG